MRSSACRIGHPLTGAVLCAILLSWLSSGLSVSAADAPVSPAGGVTNFPVVTIRQFLDSARAWGETNFFRLQGVVTASLTDKTYFIQDGDAGVYIFHRPATAPRVGDWVEVTGHPSLGNITPLLDGTTVRSFGPRALPSPETVTFAEAMSARPHMRLIRIQGRLAEERPRGGRNLVLNAGGSTNSFVADLDSLPDYDKLARIAPGSLLEISGVCGVRADATKTRAVSLTVFVRTAADVVVLSGPPWWSRERILTALAIALGTLGLALLWSWTLRRQVRRQTADLRQSEQYRRTIIEAEPECVKVVSADGRLLDMNPAGLAMLEAGSLAEAQSCPLTRFILPRHQAAFADLHKRVMAGDSGTLEFEIEGLQGTRRWLETHAVPLPAVGQGQPALLGITRDITQRKLAEAQLCQSQEQFATVFKTMPDAIMIVRAADEQILAVNPAFVRLTGFAIEETKGQTTRGLNLWVDSQQRAATITAIRQVGAVRNLESRLRTRSGRVITVQESGEMIEFSGEPCLLSITRDITDRKLAEDALRRSEASLAAAQRVALLGSWESELINLYDSDANPLTWSDEVFRIFGYEPHGLKVTKENFFQAVHPEDRERVRRTAAESLAQRKPYDIEHRVVRPDGTERVVHEHSEIIVSPTDGKPLRMLGVVQDITERKAAESALREREREFSTLLKNLSGMVYRCQNDPDWTTTFVSDGCLAVTGYHREELIGNRKVALGSLIQLEDAGPVWEKCQANLAAHRACSNEYRIRTATGEERWVWDQAQGVYSDTGELLFIEGYISDITTRKKAELALQENRERLDGILASLDEVVWSSTADGSRMLYLNPAAATVCGRPVADFFADPYLWLKLIHPDDSASVNAAFACLLQGGDYNVRYRMLRPDGTVRWLHDRARVVQDADGRPLRLDGLAADITTQMEAEDRIRLVNLELEQRVAQRTAELAAANKELESFGYSVSHDLRAPLRAIEGFSKSLQEECSSQLDAKGLRYLDRLRGGSRRMSALIEGLLNLSRFTRLPLQTESVDLNPMVRGTLAELRAAEPERKVEAVIATDLRVQGDPTLLRAALQNLVGNAWKYSSRVARAKIEFGLLEQEGERIFFIRDNGAGFDMACADKLFGAFQRLHGLHEFEGTGVGLATVQRIILRHGGRIWAEAAVGQGATFYFTLAPKADQPLFQP